MSKHLISASVIALGLGASPALADLTATQIWEEWQAIQTAQGVTMTVASQTYEGGVLTLNGITTQQSLPDGASTGRLEEIVMTERADGSVAFTVSPVYDITVSFTDDGEPVVLPMKMVFENLTGKVSGDDRRVYSYLADGIALEFDMSDDEVDMEMVMRAGAMVSTTDMNAGTSAPWDFITDTTLADAKMDMAFKAPGEGAFDLDYTFDGLKFGGTGSFEGGEIDPMAGLAGMGLVINGGFSMDSSVFTMEIDEEGEVNMVSGSTGPGSYAMDLSGETFAINATGRDTVVKMQGSEIPFPVEMSMGNTEVGLRMPVGAQDEAPVGLKIIYEDLVLSDIIWGLFDPTGQLPRDPMTVAVDLEGTATTFVDFFNATEMEKLGTQAPGEINSVTLKALKVSAAGAELRGDGDVKIINEGSAYGPGVPQPVGKLNLALDGAFALVDKLVAMGFVPPEQGAMAKGMSGMIARPAGDDKLVSELVFDQSGQILANGLPLPFAP